MFLHLSAQRVALQCIMAALVCVLSTGNLSAQDRPKGPKPKREKMPADGKLLGMARGVLKVQTEDGGQWYVALGRNTQNISVVGQADANWLKPGLLVRFSGNFDRKGEAIAPIRELSIISLREGMRFGAYPQTSAGGLGGVGGGLFGDAEEEANKKPKTTRAKKPKPEDITYNVIGKIVKIRKGELSIAAGRLLKIELAEKPRIDLDVSDLSLVPPGASIKVDAWYVPNQPGRAMANSITVALEQPLVGQTKTVRGVAPPAKEGEQKEGEGKDGEGKEGEDKDGADKDASERENGDGK